MESKKLLFILLTFSILNFTGCGGSSSSTPPPPPPPLPGEITVTITGVPDNVVADVRLIQVLSPLSTIWDVSNSQTFTNLQLGSYSVLAETFRFGLTEYVLETERRINFELIEGATEVIEVVYTPRDILPSTISITIDSLVVPDIPSLLLEGPEGFSQTVSGSSVIENLVPGCYIFFAPDFTIQNQNYGFDFDNYLACPKEGEIATVTAVVEPVPVKFKSIESLPTELIIGVPDNQGNRFTIENSPQIPVGVARHFLHKWDSLGNKLWTTEIINQTYAFWSWKLTVDGEGNTYLAGYEDVGNFIGIQNQNKQSELYKYNSSGQLLWTQNITGLYAGELAKVHEIGIQNGKVLVFGTLEPLVGNILGPREALLTVVESSNGIIFDSISDSTTNDFTQLIPIDNQGYWIFASNKIIHYSAEGSVLETLVTGNGVEPRHRELTGGVAYWPDPLGGFYVMTTVDGPTDSDIQLTRYNSNFTIDWQEVIISNDRDSPEYITYDSSTRRLLLQFISDDPALGNFGGRVLSEWDSSGNQIWLRKYRGFGGVIKSITRESNNIDWNIRTNSLNGGAQYGKGNSIIIGQ